MWRRALALLLAMGSRGSLLPLEAERLRASVGGYAVMNCHLDFPFGNEIPYHLQWDKDGEVIFSWYSGEAAPRVADRWGGRVRRVGARGAGALGGGALNVSAVRETDAGLYRCRVSFPNRSPPARNNGTFYYLDVDGGNLIVTPPMNATVLEGERAELECLPKSREWAVQWFRDGVPAAAPEPNGSLVLPRAASADPAEYECRVSAPDGRRQSATAFLDVQYKAKVVYSPKERYLPYGKSASLDCHFSANPPLTNLRWEKDGFLFDPYNVPGVFYSRNGSLLFNRVDESHEGLYSCTPYNALGSGGPSAGVRVRVLRPPALGARPQPLYVARLGGTVTLPCGAAPAPPDAPPSVRWLKKDGGALPEGRHSLSEGNLTISSVAEEDRGVYVCRVSNDAAELRVESELLVENVPPRAPHGLRARVDASAVHVTWEPGRGAADAEHTLWYRARGSSEWRTLRVLTRGATTATLRGLRERTAYEVRVLAQDARGDGLFSRPLLVRTPDAERVGTDADGAGTDADPAETDTERSETEADAAATESADPGPSTLADLAPWTAEGAELAVSVRLLEEGALVVWRRAAGDAARCSLRWYDHEQRLRAAADTLHDYALVGEVEEGGTYRALVACAGGRGEAQLAVPRYGRLRGAALGAAAGAALLAALGAALLWARRRMRASRHKRAR